jgi:hypothetical protein
VGGVKEENVDLLPIWPLWVGVTVMMLALGRLLWMLR